VLAKGRRAQANVYGDVEDRAARHAHQLVLGMRRRLKMQAAHSSHRRRQRLVVLQKYTVKAGGGEARLTVGLHEISATVAKLFGCDQQNVRQKLGYDFRHTSSLFASPFEWLVGGLATPERRQLLSCFSVLGGHNQPGPKPGQ